MTSYLLESDFAEPEIAWIDEQIARGRFVSRAAAVLELLRRGLESESMPASHINDPDHWHKRAEEMRALARDVQDHEARVVMLRLAADYDKLSQRAARRADGLSPTQQS
jgi:Arc/MetJ-type ribon-helix-helix transcriptional regulator